MHLLGNASIPWLKAKTTGWIALLLLCMWRWTGVNMLYFISGLKSIYTSLYESADIDGANAKQVFVVIQMHLGKIKIQGHTFQTTSRPSWKEAKKPARSGNAISTQRIAKSPVDNTDATL